MSAPAACWDEKLVVSLYCAVVKCNCLHVRVHWQRLETQFLQFKVNPYFEIKKKKDHLLIANTVVTQLREDKLTSFLSHTSMSYWWKNSILLRRRLSLCTFMTCVNGPTCVCVRLHLGQCSWYRQSENTLLHKMSMFFYCVIYTAEPCWGEFCRKAAARPWWPWWSCRQSFPVEEPQHRSATRLLRAQER